MLNRRQFLASAAALAQPARRRPNIVVFFTDDQGYGDLGPFGATGYETPHFDRMAREGVKFTSFYSAAPVCTPSRAALLTGCYPIRVGLGHRVLFPYSVTGLDPDEVTIADMLKPLGYATGCIGKWHLGHLPKFLPTEQGFDYYYGVPYSNDMGGSNYQQISFKAPPLPVMRNKEIIERAPAQASLTGRFTEEAVRFIRQHASEPFFLYVPHCMPHTPLDASEAFKGKSAHGLYGDVIRELDWSMGEILGALRSQGIDDNTMVLFTSDNGPVVWEGLRRGYRSGSAGPLRGAKNSTWEGGMRVPFLARWPGRIAPGRVCDELATTMDVLPTVAQLTGAQPPRDRIIDGRSIVPLLTGESGARTPHDRFYYYRDDRLEAVRSGDWKLHVHKPDWPAQSPPQLYNLRSDIGETTDLAAGQPAAVQRLQAFAAEAREDLGDAAIRKVGRNVRPIGRIP
ncbi:MAG: sulfatase [Bryobacteraceae bacterium]|nr:sulfatase [Bryobacteraceae bacterium]